MKLKQKYLHILSDVLSLHSTIYFINKILLCSIILQIIFVNDGLSQTQGGPGLVPSQCWNNYCVALQGNEDVSEHSEKEVSIQCLESLVITDLKDLCLYQLPSSAKTLEISNTSISIIPTSAFSTLVNLKKLILRNNKISDVEPAAFFGLSNLRRLDLSHNKLSFINGSHFYGLDALHRLKISFNPLKTLHASIVKLAPNLRLIELAGTELECDCHISWLLFNHGSEDGVVSRRNASEVTPASALLRDGTGVETPFKIIGNPLCGSPPHLSSKRIRQLTLRDLQCNREENLGRPLLEDIEIWPDNNQIVFAGDELKLACFVANKSDVEISWIPPKSARNDSQAASGYSVKTHSRANFWESVLEFSAMIPSYSGQWTCLAENNRDFKISRSVEVYVIHSGTKYCPKNVTIGNKGVYAWPRSVDSTTIELPCQSEPDDIPDQYLFGLSSQEGGLNSTDRRPRQHASHLCTSEGKWSDLNTSRCPFASKTSRILHRISSNVPRSSDRQDRLLASSQTLLNFTRTHVLSSTLDLHLIARSLDLYLDRMTPGPYRFAIARSIFEIVDSASSANIAFLSSAETENSTCSKLLSILWRSVDGLEGMGGASGTSTAASRVPQVRGEAFFVACTRTRDPTPLFNPRTRLVCVSNDTLQNAEYYDEYDVTIIFPPGSLLSRDGNENEADQNRLSSSALQIIVYETSSLFQWNREDAFEVTSPVVGARIVGETDLRINYVLVTIRSLIYSKNISGVVWQQDGDAKNGKWSSNYCKITRVFNSYITLNCSCLGYITIMQDMSSFHNHLYTKGAPFKLSPLPIYIGSAICGFFLAISIVTWIIRIKSIKTMTKNKHSFVNTWVALFFLILVYTYGIHQTEILLNCQIIGLLIYYFSLCVLLWMLVSISNIYKKVTKVMRINLQPEDECDGPVPPKPMLRFYLIGWGVGLILSGVTSAVSLRNFATFTYCFVAWNPSIVAFYIPCVIIMFTILVVFILAHYLLSSVLRRYPDKIKISNSQPTEIDRGIDSTCPVERPLRQDEIGALSPVSEVASIDSEHSALTLLRFHAIIFILYILSWVSAAITAASTFSTFVQHHSLIFSLIYALCSSGLGIFIFVFFCVKRRDAKIRNAFYPRPQCFSENSLPPISSSCTNSIRPSNNQNVNGHALSPKVTPSTRSICSSRTNPANQPSLRVINYEKQDVSYYSANGSIFSSVDTFQNTEGVRAEIFYNPKQSAIAKRFFLEQRRKNLMKCKEALDEEIESDTNSTTHTPVKLKYKIASDFHVAYSKADDEGQFVSNDLFNDTSKDVTSDSGELSSEYVDEFTDRKSSLVDHNAHKTNFRPMSENSENLGNSFPCDFSSQLSSLDPSVNLIENVNISDKSFVNFKHPYKDAKEGNIYQIVSESPCVDIKSNDLDLYTPPAFHETSNVQRNNGLFSSPEGYNEPNWNHILGKRKYSIQSNPYPLQPHKEDIASLEHAKENGSLEREDCISDTIFAADQPLNSDPVYESK